MVVQNKVLGSIRTTPRPAAPEMRQPRRKSDWKDTSARHQAAGARMRARPVFFAVKSASVYSSSTANQAFSARASTPFNRHGPTITQVLVMGLKHSTRVER